MTTDQQRPLTAAQREFAKAMPERDLEENVRQLCKVLGLRRYHTHNSINSPEGFPDDVIVGDSILYRELKRYGKNPSAKQQEWLDALAAGGADVAVWRPEDWFSGRIEAELRAISTRR